MQKQEFKKWEKESDELCEEMDEWRETYSCPHNCWEWKRWKFCQHLRKARAKEFGEEIELQIIKLVDI